MSETAITVSVLVFVAYVFGFFVGRADGMCDANRMVDEACDVLQDIIDKNKDREPRP